MKITFPMGCSQYFPFFLGGGGEGGGGRRGGGVGLENYFRCKI